MKNADAMHQWWILIGNKDAGRARKPPIGAESGQVMADRRFVFVFPVLNLYEVIVAASAIEARHKLMNSNLAPFYGQAVLLSR